MNLVFDRAQSLLVLLGEGVDYREFPAANNAASNSRGPWPVGTFEPKQMIRVGGPEGEPEGAYGPWFLPFDVPGRTGMGIHAGREGKADKRGRAGYEHATMGCIRTTTEGIVALVLAIQAHGLPKLQVIDGGHV